MSRTLAIESVGVLDFRSRIQPGSDGFFVTVSAAGLLGWYGPVSQPVAAYAQTYLQQAVVGQSAYDHSAVHESMRREGAEADGRVRSWAIGAVDCAVWDLHGRAANTPVAHLLAAEPAEAVRAYASWLRFDITEPFAVDEIRRVVDADWAFTKWALPADAATSPTELARRAQLVAEAAGGQAAFDALCTWTTDIIAAFAQEADPAAIIWLEDPLTETTDYCHVTVPSLSLAVGEHFIVDDNLVDLLTAIRPAACTIDVVGCGGLTRALDLLNLARGTGIRIFPHGRSFTPGAHLAAAYPDIVPAVEYRVQWEPLRQQLFTDPLIPEKGQIRLPATSGLSLMPRS